MIRELLCFSLCAVRCRAFDGDLAIYAADLVKIAYCSSSNVSTCSAIECQKYNLSISTFGVHKVGTFLQHGTGAYGYVGYDSGADNIVVVFAGSSTASMFKEDMRCDLKMFAGLNDTGYVLAGAYDGFCGQRQAVLDLTRALRNVHPNATLWIVGHSLGATQALYAALELSLAGLSPAKVYALAPMRPGTKDFAQYYMDNVRAETVRLAHYKDPVVRIPPLPTGDYACHRHADFRHVGDEAYYGRSVSKEEYTLCPGTIENRSSRCGANRWDMEELSIETFALEAGLYHQCYPGQCGLPRSLGIPCRGPLCHSPSTALGEFCHTGSVCKRETPIYCGGFVNWCINGATCVNKKCKCSAGSCYQPGILCAKYHGAKDNAIALSDLSGARPWRSAMLVAAPVSLFVALVVLNRRHRVRATPAEHTYMSLEHPGDLTHNIIS